MDATASQVPNSTTATLSETQRLISAFIAPSSTFKDIKQKSKWLVAWLVVSICVVASTFVMLQKADLIEFIRTQIQNSSRADMFQQLPAQQQQQQLQLGATIARIEYYGTPIFMFVAALIVAAMLMSIFNLAFDARLSFPRSVAIMSYSLMPIVVKSILLIIVWTFSDPQHLDLRNPLVTNAAAFLSPAGNKFLFGVAENVDIFRIWILCLIGLGFSIGSESRSLGKGKAMGIVFGSYVLWTLAASGVGAALQ